MYKNTKKKMLQRFYRYHEHLHLKALQENDKTVILVISYWSVFKQCLPQLLNIFLSFSITLSMFPAVLSGTLARIALDIFIIIKWRIIFRRHDRTISSSEKNNNNIWLHFLVFLGQYIITKYIYFSLHTSLHWFLLPRLVDAMTGSLWNN